jgi:hypothetical protein
VKCRRNAFSLIVLQIRVGVKPDCPITYPVTAESNEDRKRTVVVAIFYVSSDLS